MRPRIRPLAILLLALAACSDSTEPVVGGVMRVVPGLDTLAAGAEVKLSVLRVTDLGEEIHPGEIIWSSTDPDVATVFRGLVTAHRSGSAEIVALAAGIRASATIQVEQRVTATSVQVGPEHICALAPDGRAWCFGANYFGQLGTGRVEESQAVPTAPVGGGMVFRALSVGNHSTCGLASDGRAWCWGAGYDLQLGHASLDHASLPVLADTIRTYDTLTSAGNVTCGLRGGVAWCWGREYRRPREIVRTGAPLLTSLAGGLECGLQETTGLACWGGLWGSEPGPDVSSASFMQFRTASAGVDSDPADGAPRSYLCVVSADRLAFCWGANAYGQLGDGTVIPRTELRRVGTLFTMVAAGPTFACGLDPAGAALCWGANHHGQLGRGDSTPLLHPRLVATTERFTTLSAGGQRVCAVSVGHELFCWGAGLGPLPVPVLY